MRRYPILAVAAGLLLAAHLPAADVQKPPEYRSHPPMRPLPAPSDRPPVKGPTLFVDAAGGDDRNDGSREKPWKTVGHGLTKLRPGDTLYLRGGTYFEHVTVSAAGTADKPITLRGYPGELAVLDGGLRDFLDDPAKAWERFGDGADGEFRSAKAYPGLGEKVSGHFADSMVPLHAYRHLGDLRSKNEFWNLKDKLSPDESFYCGPGLWYDAKSGHVHARLAHTTLAALGEDNYRGEADPRKLPLAVAGTKTPLRLDGAKHLRVQDLVVRGSTKATVAVSGAEDVEFDNVTAYGGSPVLMVDATAGLRILNSALRGVSAPWSTRAGHKYRGTSAYLLVVRGGKKPCRDFEIAHSELTDSHDGPYVGTVRGLKLHHCLVENFNDDGIYLTAEGVGGDVHIYQNRLARCLHVFSFHGNYEPGAGVFVYRNLIDLRGPIHYHHPKAADDPLFKPKTEDGPPRFPASGRVCGDHGSPAWEPVHFYHNTVITCEPPFRNGYAAGWGNRATGKTARRVFNNVFVQVEGLPGLVFGPADADFEADGNLLWGVREGPAVKGDFFAAFRKSATFAASKKRYPPGWGAGDLFGDPRFVRFGPEWADPLDARPKEGSPAVDAGVALPEDWPDPLRKLDKGKPDVGAFPLGAEPWPVGRTVAEKR